MENKKSGDDEVYQSASIFHKVMAYVRQGCEVVMATGGPLLRSPVLGVGVRISRVGQLPSASSDVTDTTNIARLHVPLGSQSLASFTALLRSTVMKALTEALCGLPEWKIIEPVMAVEIRIPCDDGKFFYIRHFDLYNRRRSNPPPDSKLTGAAVGRVVSFK